MAKENTAWLVAEVYEEPNYNEKMNRTHFRVKTLVRTLDELLIEEYPQVKAFGEAATKAKEFKPGDIILVKGFISTTDVNKISICPYCGEEKKGKT